MKEEYIRTLIQYRIEQAQDALHDAQSLLSGGGVGSRHYKPFLLRYVLCSIGLTARFGKDSK